MKKAYRQPEAEVVVVPTWHLLDGNTDVYAGATSGGGDGGEDVKSKKQFFDDEEEPEQGLFDYQPYKPWTE